MVNLFNTILEMSIKGGIVILTVILLRAILHKAPKKYSYLLWVAVMFRLCCPISLKAFFSIFTFGTPKAPTLPNAGGDIVIISDDFGSRKYIFNATELLNSGNASIEFSERLNWIEIFNTTVMIIWFTGMAVALIYNFYSYFRLKAKMSNAIRLENNVYMSEKVSSPFTLGFFKPKIYIPFGLDENTLEQILLHERCHIKRLDHIIKPLSFLILSVHWFNPLCWIGFRLMTLDMEMSCDEKVLETKGDEVMKKNYSRALLSFATEKRFPAPSPIAFSESSGNAKRRIKHALYWKKSKLFVNILCIVICIAVLAACGVDAETAKWKDVKTETFGEKPYNFVFLSNGDGTSVIKEIKIDKDYSGDIHLIIPEKAPNGDTVVAIENVWGMKASQTKMNLPTYLTFERMNEVYEHIKNYSDSLPKDTSIYDVGKSPERDAKIFFAFYMEKINENGVGYYELEPSLSFEEYDRLATILRAYGYNEDECYNDTVIFLESITDDDDKRNEFAREAFKFRYFNGVQINEITLPESVKFICYGAFDGCVNLKKINGIAEDCKLEIDETREEAIVINGTDKNILLGNNPDYNKNYDFINALN